MAQTKRLLHLHEWLQHLHHNPSPPPQEPGGNHTPPQLSPSVGQAAYTAGVPGGSLDVQHLIMQADARRRQRSNDNYFEDVPRSKLERQMAQVSMVRKGSGEGRSGVECSGVAASMNGGSEGVIRHAPKSLRPVVAMTVGVTCVYHKTLKLHQDAHQFVFYDEELSM